MTEQRFVYVSYIRTTPDKLWRALTNPEFTRQYWWDRAVDSQWTVGSPVEYRYDEGRELDIVGEILACDPPKLLSYTFSDPAGRERGEKPSRVVFAIEPEEGITKLTVTHDDFEPGSPTYEGVSHGWPGILSSLKTLLESDEALPNV